MLFFKVLFCVFVLSGSEISFAFAERSCTDCVSISSCKSGLDFARGIRQGTRPATSRQTLVDSICGRDAYDSRIPKVCCSDFDTTVTPAPIAPKPTVPIPHSENRMLDPIESHSNIGLLPTSCGDIDGSRIINGVVPKLYELPWMTLIGYHTTAGVDFRCAGSVINSRYILTAAHCVTNGKTLKKIAGVRVGEFDYTTDTDCQGAYDSMICESKIQDILVEEIIPHRSFTGNQPIEADIALLRLSETIEMTNNAAPICLPIYSDLRNLRLAGNNATIAGWGVTENKTSSTVLLKAEIPILSNDVCSHFYNRYEHQRRSLIVNMFCAGAMMKDSCDGDSGGPLILESDFKGQIRLVQYGIVSFGPTHCGTQFPGVYTDVTKYMDWILDNIRA